MKSFWLMTCYILSVVGMILFFQYIGEARIALRDWDDHLALEKAIDAACFAFSVICANSQIERMEKEDKKP